MFLTACGRPLSEGERRFARELYGASLNTNRIRLVDGALLSDITYPRNKRPRLTCRERIVPEPKEDVITVSPSAYVIHNKVFFNEDWYRPDYMEGFPKMMSLGRAMLYAHEITHVWQWQNRAKTGYTPLRGLSEHGVSDDPYLFDITTNNAFLDYGYEQQASLVEEYVCCATLDPEAPRTKRLRKMLRGAFPLGNLTLPGGVYIPWEGAEIKGICRI